MAPRELAMDLHRIEIGVEVLSNYSPMRLAEYYSTCSPEMVVVCEQYLETKPESFQAEFRQHLDDL